MPVNGSTERHPLISILLLLLLFIAGSVVFTIIAAVAGALIYGLPDLLKFFSGDFSNNLGLTRLIQIISTIGMFILPAFFFARLESSDWKSYLSFRKPVLILFLLTILLSFASAPLMELSSEINQQMKLPSFLHDLEAWMRSQEDQLAEVTIKLLQMNSISILFLNLLMLAALPALGEELIFRGCLQKLLNRWILNHHAAIWITAIVFSAIHVQFYGFIPRMLLGALFGYLFFWNKSIWLPILAHFINNSVAVITAYVYQKNGVSLDKLSQPDPVGIPVYLISFALSAALLFAFYRITSQNLNFNKQSDGAELG